MQSQMEAKLASMSLKSPGFASPTTRNFNLGPSRTSSGDNFLSPDSATLQGQGNMDAANTLAQQRAKLKASNVAHRISAPILADNRNTWSASQLGQVAERPSSPAQEITLQPPPPGSRPKSTDFSGAANSFRAPRPSDGLDALSPIVGDSWASMVNTPLIPMFQNTNKDQQRNGQNLDAAVNKLNDWAAGNRVPLMDDAKKYRRPSKASSVVSDQHSEDQQSGSERRGFRNVSGTNNSPNHNGNNNQPGPGNWGSTLRSPALSAGGSGFNGDGGLNSAGMGVGGFNVGLGSPGIGMGLPRGMLGGMPSGMPVSPFGAMDVNMLNMMGMTPETLLAAQMAAAAGQFTSGNLTPLQVQMAVMQQQQQQQQAANQRAARTTRSPGVKSSVSGRTDKKDEEEVDPKLLEDVPAWLRSLRLHKYTPNFEGMSWRDMVILDEAQLEAKGVAALGARRKMLKTFEVVRKKMNVEFPAGTTTTTTTTA